MAVTHGRFFNHTGFPIDIPNGKGKTAIQNGCLWGKGGEFKCRFHTGKVNLPYRFMQEGRLGEFQGTIQTGKVN